jgi:hypothetical protein
MPATRNLKPSPSSEAARRKAPARNSGAPFSELGIIALALVLIGAAAAWFFYSHGYLLYYGDAQAHLDIARRMLDSRTPGYKQIGTVWLPLPHALMLPFVGNDFLWRSGLAGTIPSTLCFVIAGLFLYSAARLALGSRAAATTATLLFALNPNLLYLQSAPMTEPVFFAALMALLYFTVRFATSGSALSVTGAAVASLAATLIRYEGWFLIPFGVLYFLLTARGRRIRLALLFGAIASLGPLYWLAHNWWYYSNALEFYNGPYSAMAIYQRALQKGMARYPGDHDWAKAWLYFRSAAELCTGRLLVWLGLAGILAALIRRAWWPLFLLALPSGFYVMSLYSSGTPIFVPHLWPNTYYNTRYGLVALPGLAFAAAALVALVPARVRAYAATLLIVAAVIHWAAYPRPENWVCWKESKVNSDARRAWTSEAATFLRANYGPGDGIFTSFGDLAGIYPQAGIPLRATLHEGNEPHWLAAAGRPDLFLWERWVVGFAGDAVTTAAGGPPPRASRYDCVLRIAEKGAPVVEIYRRVR